MLKASEYDRLCNAWHSRNYSITAEQRDAAGRYCSASKRGDVDEVLRLIDSGIPIDSGESGCCGHFPIVIGACERGDVKLVQELLTRGAIPIHQECAGESSNPIFFCAMQKKFPQKAALDGSSRTTEQNEAVLQLLLKHHYVPEYKSLLRGCIDNCADVYSRSWWEHGGGRGTTFEERDLMALLTDAGAGLIAGQAVLHEACQEGASVVIELLLATHGSEAHGIDVNARNTYGETALSVAAEYWELEGGHLACMQILLRHGAMLTAADATEALESCRQNSNLDCDWNDDIDKDTGLRDAPPAMLIRKASKCHPHRIEKARAHLRRIVPIVGRWCVFLLRLYTEVAHRPGNSGMQAAQEEFGKCIFNEAAKVAGK